ncbi:hypothetical protein Tco_1004479 [Tanacetum coccineum]|uniref:Uncharacterized protein n=1 Tax=Tanacetum coccineum TaxID=301880 RepID=A0ABQ5FC11_9ASTR
MKATMAWRCRACDDLEDAYINPDGVSSLRDSIEVSNQKIAWKKGVEPMTLLEKPNSVANLLAKVGSRASVLPLEVPLDETEALRMDDRRSLSCHTLEHTLLEVNDLFLLRTVTIWSSECRRGSEPGLPRPRRNRKHPGFVVITTSIHAKTSVEFKTPEAYSTLNLEMSFGHLFRRKDTYGESNTQGPDQSWKNGDL